MYKLTGFADEIDQSLEVQLEVLGKLGINYVEMRGVNGKPLIEHTIEEAGAIKRRLDEAGVKLSSVGSSIGKIMITDDFGPHIELFKHTVEIARLFEVGNIRIFSFFIPEGDDPAAHRDEVMRRMEALSDYASRKGVVLLHENEKEIYGDNAARCLEIMERFASPSFRAVFDFANFVQVGQDTLEAWEVLKKYVSYIHVKDALAKDGSVVPAGKGDGHLAEILSDLRDSGYDGFLSLEPHLADFSGFSALETHGSGLGRALTGEEGFTLARDSLLDVLDAIGWK